MMKWWHYILCIVLIIVGVFSAIGSYKIITAKSYVIGSAEIDRNKYIESYHFSVKDISFYLDDTSNEYVSNIKLSSTDVYDYNKNYRMIINGYCLNNINIHRLYINSIFTLNFYDKDENCLHNASVDIELNFYVNETILTLTCDNNTDSKYFEDYFSKAGFRFQLVEV